MIFLHPVWLMLAIPLGVSLWLMKAPSRLLQVLRIAIVVLMVLAMAGVAVKLPSRHGTVVIVADRSSSMPADNTAREKEIIELVQSGMSGSDKLAVVSFGEDAALERAPQAGKFSGFVARMGSEGSNLGEAIEMATALVPRESPGRILVVSDGRWTGKDPLSAVSKAVSRDLAIDYRLLERPSTNDLAIYRIDAPRVVTPGESFMLTVWVQSPLQQQIIYQLQRGNQTIASGDRVVSAGLTRLSFRDKSSGSGTIQYRFTVGASADDPVPENNSARMLVGVEGQKPVLCVTNSMQSGFSSLISSGKLNVRPALADDCNWTLEDLSGYSAVVIEDVPAGRIGMVGMENIAAWVKETGAGFMMTGGKSSYGPGGYFKSPLEPIMPVSMELRREHRKLSLAIVVAMDRSGSMAASVGGGKTKMDLANVAAVQVLDMLSPMDEFGVLAVDSIAHEIVGLAPVEKNIAYRGKILSIDSMGGGIFVYEALSHAAAMLDSATPQTKHIILFSDARDSEQPGKYKELLEECTQAGMTVSVIGLGSESDVDAELLKDIAKLGQGRCFFTQSASELPRLFAQDTFVVARSSFLEEPTTVDTTAGLISVTNKRFDIVSQVGGYNLCYLRPEANLGVVTVDEYEAPFVASWQVGAGRTLCYTGQADGKFTGDIAGWDQMGDFLTSLVRWTAGQESDLGPQMLITQEVTDGTCVIKLHMDPERQGELLEDLPKVTTLHGEPGKAPNKRSSSMYYIDADTLAVQVPISGSETALSSVDVGTAGVVTLPPVCLPYSPEYRPAQPGKGLATLEEMAKATRGIERVNLTDIWKSLPKRVQMIPIGKWLLLVAIVLLLVEVFERRTGLVSRRKWKVFPAGLGRLSLKYLVPERKPKRVKVKKVAAEKKVEEKPAEKKTAKKDRPQPTLLDAMNKAQRSARARTKKKK